MAHSISTVYSHYKRLTAKQRSRLIASLNEQGIHVTDIEAYEYPDAPGIKHLFIYFSDSQEAIPYFVLNEKVWEQIQSAIMRTR